MWFKICLSLLLGLKEDAPHLDDGLYLLLALLALGGLHGLPGLLQLLLGGAEDGGHVLAGVGRHLQGGTTM